VHTAQINIKSRGHAQLPHRCAPARANFQFFCLTDLETAPKRRSRYNRLEQSPDPSGASSISFRRSPLSKSDFRGCPGQQYSAFMYASLSTGPSPVWSRRLTHSAMIFIASREGSRDRWAPISRSLTAPGHYPFLLNASGQDKTQCNGFRFPTVLFSTRSTKHRLCIGVFADFRVRRQLPCRGSTSASNSLSLPVSAARRKIASLKPRHGHSRPKPILVDKGPCSTRKTAARCPTRTFPDGTGSRAVKTGRHAHPGCSIMRQCRNPACWWRANAHPPRGATLARPAKTARHPQRPGGWSLAQRGLPAYASDSNVCVWRAIKKNMSHPCCPSHKITSRSRCAVDPIGEKPPWKPRKPLAMNVSFRRRPNAPPGLESRVLHAILAGQQLPVSAQKRQSLAICWELLTPPEQESPFFMVAINKYDP